MIEECFSGHYCLRQNVSGAKFSEGCRRSRKSISSVAKHLQERWGDLEQSKGSLRLSASATFAQMPTWGPETDKANTVKSAINIAIHARAFKTLYEDQLKYAGKKDQEWSYWSAMLEAEL